MVTPISGETTAAASLLPTLYAAAAGNDQWATFLDLLAKAVRAPRAHITYLNNLGTAPINVTRQWIQQVGLGDELLAEAVKYSHLDGWWRALTQGPYPEGWVGRGSELWHWEDMVKSELYRVVLRKYDFVRPTASILLKRSGEIAVCSVIRGEQDGEFEDSTLGLLREMNPHMRTAIQVYNTVGGLRQNLSSLELALEQFAVGVIVVDDIGSVIFANSVATRQFSAKDGMILEHGRIKTTCAQDYRRFLACVESAIRTSKVPTAGSRVIGVAPISRARGPVLHAFIAPWLAGPQIALAKPAAVLLVTGTEQRIPEETWLQSLYNLTKAESKLAILIAGGLDGPEAAEKLGLSAETVRTRLKTVFGKTNTRRQSDLARLVARLPQGWAEVGGCSEDGTV